MLNNKFHELYLLKYKKQAKKIMQLENTYAKYSNEELKEKTLMFKEAITNGESIDSIKIEAFAVVREAAFRVLGYRHHEVQLIGGLILLEGNISEMKTGEGKTLTTTLPSYVRALEGKGVHIITVNEYLAKRDCEQMGPIYELLGLNVGINLMELNTAQKRAAYDSDITYGIGNEFGFDYLRDNHVYDKAQKVQRPFHYALIDEIDSILIDEGRTPLILASPYFSDQSLLRLCQDTIMKLKEEIHYEIEPETKSCFFTYKGISFLENELNVSNLYDVENYLLLHRLTQALKANKIFKINVDYIVENEKIQLIDSNTGRVMEGRSLTDGLHQAIEAKENVSFSFENRTQSLITLQNFYQKYPILSGLTGTAKTEEREFLKLYNSKVVQVPTHKPVIRVDHLDEVYLTKEQKYCAIINRVKEIFPTGRPILIGTTSISQSFELARYLDETDIPFEVLNAHSVECETEIIKRAGNQGNVIIATNMAGRGTDIILNDNTIDLGGLYVIGTERHQSRRIDRQLIGRAGRQGNPGDSVFIVSLEDELFVRYGEEKISKILPKLKISDEGQILTTKIHRIIDNIQTVCESLHYSSREYMMKFNDVVNEQRDTIYEIRNRLFDQKYRINTIFNMIEETIHSMLCIEDESYEEGNEDLIRRKLRAFLPTDWLQNELNLTDKMDVEKSLAALLNEYKSELISVPDEIKDTFVMRTVQIIDRHWLELIETMEHIKQGIGNSSYSQEQPLRVYTLEGFKTFTYYYRRLREDVTKMVCSVYSNTRQYEQPSVDHTRIAL